MAKHTASQELVSVVVPAYGHAAYIEEALNSVYDQTHTAIELIVIDDCSPDDTFKLAQAWARQKKARFVNVRIEQNVNNIGAHASINRGLAIAQGQWPAILNSDDRYGPERLEHLLAAADNTAAQILFSGVRVIDDHGQRCLSTPLAAELEAACDFAATFPSISFALLVKNIAVTTGNLMFSDTLYRKTGVFRAMKYCHDWDFLLRASLITEPHCLNAALYDYRIHSSNSFAGLKFEQYLEPQAVYRNYFVNLAQSDVAKRNPLAPAPDNWPLLFEQICAANDHLNDALQAVGGPLPLHDRLAKMISYMAQSPT